MIKGQRLSGAIHRHTKTDADRYTKTDKGADRQTKGDRHRRRDRQGQPDRETDVGLVRTRPDTKQDSRGPGLGKIVSYLQACYSEYFLPTFFFASISLVINL